MRRFHFWSALFLGAGLCLSLAGCGSRDEAEDVEAIAEGEEAPAPEEPAASAEGEDVADAGAEAAPTEDEAAAAEGESAPAEAAPAPAPGANSATDELLAMANNPEQGDAASDGSASEEAAPTPGGGLASGSPPGMPGPAAGLAGGAPPGMPGPGGTNYPMPGAMGPGVTGYPMPGASSGGSDPRRAMGGSGGYPMPGASGSGGPGVTGYPMPGGSGGDPRRSMASGGPPPGYPMPGAPGAGGPPGGLLGSGASGFGGGPGGPSGAAPKFDTPIDGARSFLDAVKSKDTHLLSEAVALRSATEAAPANRAMFQSVLDGAIDQDTLDKLAQAFEGMDIMGTNDSKSTGSLGVIVGKTLEDGNTVTRTLTMRREKAGWKVQDVSKQRLFRNPQMKNAPGQNRGQPAGRGGYGGGYRP